MARRFVTKKQPPQSVAPDQGTSNHIQNDNRHRGIKQEPDAAQGGATNNALARETSSRDFFPSSSVEDKNNVFADNSAQGATNRAGNGATFNESSHHAALGNGMVMSNGAPLIRGGGGANANVS